MPTTLSADMKSVMTSFGVDLTDLNSTDLLAELVIDTFDQWSNPTDAFAAGCVPSTRSFDVAALHD